MIKIQTNYMKDVQFLVIFFLILSLMAMTIPGQLAIGQKCNHHCQFEVEFSEKIGTTKDTNEKYAFMEIDVYGSWSGTILDTDYTSATKSGYGSNTIAFKCSPYGIYSLFIQKQNEYGEMHVKVVKKGVILKQAVTNAPYGVTTLSGNC